MDLRTRLTGWLQCQLFGHVAASCMPYRNRQQPGQPITLTCPRCGKPFTIEPPAKR